MLRYRLFMTPLLGTELIPQNQHPPISRHHNSSHSVCALSANSCCKPSRTGDSALGTTIWLGCPPAAITV